MSIRTAARISFLRLIFPVLLAAMAAGGCSALKSGTSNHGPQTVVWKLADQFVRVQPQDAKAPLVPNDQPATLAPARLGRILGALEVKFPSHKKALPVFSKPELEILGKALSAGLAQAGPDQDVVFAIIGMHPGAFTLERRLTTGRVFYRNGKLNLIFGSLQAVFDDTLDRRLHPFLAGSREAGAPPSWRIVNMTGVKHFVQGHTARPDWLILDPARMEAPTAGTGHTEVKEVSCAVKATGEDRAETEALKAQQKKLQGEISELRQKLSGAQSGKAASGEKLNNIRARLELLKKLRQENLITEKEYQEKKRQILKEL